MDKQLFQRYAEIKNRISELEEEAKEIALSVTEEMKTNEVDEVKSDFGTFYFTSRKTWKYSPKIDELSNQLKDQKKKEEQDGTATYEESKSLTFRSK